jgi:hypothetical protein
MMLGKKSNMTQTILNIVKDAKKFPVIITNKDIALIEESAHIIKQLEDNGYMCVTFSKGDTYGIRVFDQVYQIL